MGRVPVKFSPKILFSLGVLLFFCFMVWEAREWRLQARLYPWTIGIPMVLLALMNIIQELRGKEKTDAASDAPADFQFTQTTDRALALRRTFNIFGWIFGFLAGMWLVGFSLTIAVLTFCFLKIQSEESWVLSLVLTGSAWLVYWGLFERTLRLPFPEGQVFLWLGY